MMNFEKDFGELSVTNEVITMEWAIENFFSKSEDLKYGWESRTFQMCDGTWHLKMSKNTMNSWSSFISQQIQVNLVSDKLVNFVPFTCMFSIKMANGNVHNYNKTVIQFKAPEFSISSFDRAGLLGEKLECAVNETVVFNLRITFEKNLMFPSTKKVNPLKVLSGGKLKDSKEECRSGIFDVQADFSDIEKLFNVKDVQRDEVVGNEKKDSPLVCSPGEGSREEIGSEKKDSHFFSKGVELLAKNLKDLFLNEEDCDVTFKVEDREFHAHRVLLAARSSMFASMFKHDMSEKNSGVVNIPDCGSDAFKELLLYLYSGMVEHSSSDITFDLYEASVKYDLEHLKNICVQFMMDDLSVLTFCDTMCISLKHNEMELIKIVTEFFSKHIEDILPTMKWQTFLKENHIAANELLIKAIIKK